jgi:hypothetical protein
LSEVEELQRRAGRNGDEDLLTRLVQLRHRAGLELLMRPSEPLPYPNAATDAPKLGAASLPELSAAELTPQHLRAAILENGCALVRGLIPRERAIELSAQADRLYAVHGNLDEPQEGGADYEHLVPELPYELIERAWVRAAGGIWLVDTPRLLHEILDLYEQFGIRRLVSEYLGSQLLLSANKSTLRRASAATSTIDWHQDGAFMGDVRTLNVWLSLSECGTDAPGLYMLPRRVERIVETGTPGARFDWSVSPAVVEAQAGPEAIVHPDFVPGDLVIFDNFFLHATWVDEEMTRARHAIETWFFSVSAFPPQYVPIAV